MGERRSLRHVPPLPSGALSGSRRIASECVQKSHTSQADAVGANSANGIWGARSVRARLTLGDTLGGAGGLSIMDSTRQERAPTSGR